MIHILEIHILDSYLGSYHFFFNKYNSMDKVNNFIFFYHICERKWNKANYPILRKNEKCESEEQKGDKSTDERFKL